MPVQGFGVSLYSKIENWAFLHFSQCKPTPPPLLQALSGFRFWKWLLWNPSSWWLAAYNDAFLTIQTVKVVKSNSTRKDQYDQSCFQQSWGRFYKMVHLLPRKITIQNMAQYSKCIDHELGDNSTKTGLYKGWRFWKIKKLRKKSGVPKLLPELDSPVVLKKSILKYWLLLFTKFWKKTCAMAFDGYNSCKGRQRFCGKIIYWIQIPL